MCSSMHAWQAGAQVRPHRVVAGLLELGQDVEQRDLRAAPAALQAHTQHASGSQIDACGLLPSACNCMAVCDAVPAHCMRAAVDRLHLRQCVAPRDVCCKPYKGSWGQRTAQHLVELLEIAGEDPLVVLLLQGGHGDAQDLLPLGRQALLHVLHAGLLSVHCAARVHAAVMRRCCCSVLGQLLQAGPRLA